MFFSDYRFSLLSTEKLIQQAFQLLGSMPVISFKKKKRKKKGENLQHWNVWLFLWLRSFKSRLSRLLPLGMPSASSLSPFAKYLTLSLSPESLCCPCALRANELQVYLTSTDLFISLPLFPLLHLSFLTSLHGCPGTAEIERILLVQLQIFFVPLFFSTLSDPFLQVLLG